MTILIEHKCLRCGAFIRSTLKSCEPFCQPCADDPKPPIHVWWLRKAEDKRAFGVRR